VRHLQFAKPFEGRAIDAVIRSKRARQRRSMARPAAGALIRSGDATLAANVVIKPMIGCECRCGPGIEFQNAADPGDGGLTYLPALALGPVIENLQMLGGVIY
jgi:hypothetical protein